MSGLLEEQARGLMDEAFQRLDRRDFEGALAVAEQLKAMRHSSAFDITAEVYAAQGQPDRAIAALEEGVRTAPGVWLLWQSLGNLLTREGELARAQEAYGRALACPQVDASSVHFNRGLAYARQQDYDEAHRCLGLVRGDHLRFKAQTFQVAVLVDGGRFADAEALAVRLLEGVPAGAEHLEDAARVEAYLGKAVLQGRGDRDAARQHARKALGMVPQDPVAMWLLRQLDGQRAAGASHWRLLVRVADRYEIRYDVVAETPQEALSFVEPFEPQGPLAVVEAESLQPRPEVLKGVYAVGGRQPR